MANSAEVDEEHGPSSALLRQTELSAKVAAHHPRLFGRLWVWGFYDGVELGLAMCADGSSYRFLTLGDSRSRRFRAYALEEVALGELSAKAPQALGISWMEEEDWLAALKLPTLRTFIAIADPYLAKLVVKQTDDPILDNANFAFAHSALRNKFLRAVP